MAGDPSPLLSDLGRDADVTAIVQQFVDKLDDRLAALREAFNRSDLPQVTSMAAADLESATHSTESVEQVGRCLDELTILCHRATASPPPG